MSTATGAATSSYILTWFPADPPTVHSGTIVARPRGRSTLLLGAVAMAPRSMPRTGPARSTDPQHTPSGTDGMSVPRSVFYQSSDCWLELSLHKGLPGKPRRHAPHHFLGRFRRSAPGHAIQTLERPIRQALPSARGRIPKPWKRAHFPPTSWSRPWSARLEPFHDKTPALTDQKHEDHCSRKRFGRFGSSARLYSSPTHSPDLVRAWHAAVYTPYE